MAQDSPQPIHLSVHEHSDPKAISRTPDAEMDAAQENLDGSIPQQDNGDVLSSSPSAAAPEDAIANNQTIIANRHAG